jgi:hypothetical protein
MRLSARSWRSRSPHSGEDIACAQADGAVSMQPVVSWTSKLSRMAEQWSGLHSAQASVPSAHGHRRHASPSETLFAKALTVLEERRRVRRGMLASLFTQRRRFFSPAGSACSLLRPPSHMWVAWVAVVAGCTQHTARFFGSLAGHFDPVRTRNYRKRPERTYLVGLKYLRRTQPRVRGWGKSVADHVDHGPPRRGSRLGTASAFCS